MKLSVKSFNFEYKTFEELKEQIIKTLYFEKNMFKDYEYQQDLENWQYELLDMNILDARVYVNLLENKEDFTKYDFIEYNDKLYPRNIFIESYLKELVK